MTTQTESPPDFAPISEEQRPPGSPCDFNIRAGDLTGTLGIAEAEIILARIILMLQEVREWRGIRLFHIHEWLMANRLAADAGLLVDGLVALASMKLLHLEPTLEDVWYAYPTRALAEHPRLAKFRTS